MEFFSSNRLERLWLLARIEFKLRYYENRLGLFWALIKPLTEIFMYYIAFNVVVQMQIPSYVAYLFIGLILWNFFLECTTGTIQILNSKKFLYEYSNMYKIDIYISTLLSNSIGLFFNFLMFFTYFLLIDKNGANISAIDLVNYLYLIPLLLTHFLLCLSFSMILSSVFVVAKDIQQIWQVFAGMLFILSPIVFKTEDYTRALPIFRELNPIAGIIINFRRVIMENTHPDYYLLGLNAAYAVILFFIGLLMLNRLGSKASEKL